jgi:hypothetical protein
MLVAFEIQTYSQFIVIDTLKPSFEWKIPLVDLPFMQDAAQAEANHRHNLSEGSAADIVFKDYTHFYRNLSMEQNTEIARNLHGTFYYAHNVLWYKLYKPTSTRRYILNRLFANITAAATDFLLIKIPYGFAYQHEEFHRSVMATRGIYSYDAVWEFGKGFDIAVTQVSDENLIWLKRQYPADMVRLMAAGVEAEYKYIQRLREDNFFESMNLPAMGISILGTIHSTSYVNLPFASRFNEITDSILSHDQNDILARDFTGYDFSAWVYDLIRYDEPYEDRGTWPGGIGIRRPIKETDLTAEMKSFLRETGNMQYLNFVSPFLVGINRMKIGNNAFFNFALRSVPTSFGYFAGGDFFLDMNDRKTLISVGVNRSKNLTLPSVEIKRYDMVPNSSHRFSTGLKLALWLQPKDQMFFAKKSSPGLMVGIEPEYKISRHVALYSAISYKTSGWVFSNPYLDNKFSFILGLSINTGVI